MEDDEQSPRRLSVDECFATNLREQRERKGLSQGELARLMTEAGYPYHQQTVAKIEKGTRPARLSEATTLAAIVGSSLTTLTMFPREVQQALSLSRKRRELHESHRATIKAIHELWNKSAKLEEEIKWADRSSKLTERYAGQGPDQDLARQLEWARNELHRNTATNALDTAANEFDRERPRKGSVVESEIELVKEHGRAEFQALFELIERHAEQSRENPTPGDEEG